jgi:hypothetical protein
VKKNVLRLFENRPLIEGKSRCWRKKVLRGAPHFIISPDKITMSKRRRMKSVGGLKGGDRLGCGGVHGRIILKFISKV